MLNGINYIKINQTVWNGLDAGEVFVIFYVNDSFGRINQTSITINKSIATGDDDDDKRDVKEERFDIIEFFLSPIGLIIIGLSVGIILVIIIIKRGGPSKRLKKEREKLMEILSK